MPKQMRRLILAFLNGNGTAFRFKAQKSQDASLTKPRGMWCTACGNQNRVLPSRHPPAEHKQSALPRLAPANEEWTYPAVLQVSILMVLGLAPPAHLIHSKPKQCTQKGRACRRKMKARVRQANILSPAPARLLTTRSASRMAAVRRAKASVSGSFRANLATRAPFNQSLHPPNVCRKQRLPAAMGSTWSLATGQILTTTCAWHARTAPS